MGVINYRKLSPTCLKVQERWCCIADVGVDGEQSCRRGKICRWQSAPEKYIGNHIWKISYVSMGDFAAFETSFAIQKLYYLDAVFKTPGVQNKAPNPPVKTLQFSS